MTTALTNITLVYNVLNTIFFVFTDYFFVRNSLHLFAVFMYTSFHFIASSRKFRQIVGCNNKSIILSSSTALNMAWIQQFIYILNAMHIPWYKIICLFGIRIILQNYVGHR